MTDSCFSLGGVLTSFDRPEVATIARAWKNNAIPIEAGQNTVASNEKPKQVALIKSSPEAAIHTFAMDIDKLANSRFPIILQSLRAKNEMKKTPIVKMGKPIKAAIP